MPSTRAPPHPCSRLSDSVHWGQHVNGGILAKSPIPAGTLKGSLFKGHGNALLATMRADALERLSEKTFKVELESKQVIYRPEEAITHIYFPDSAVIAMLTMMEDGATIESATVGSEGASWISASLHSPSMPCQTTVAIGGTAFRVPSALVEQEIRRNGTFHNVLSAYSHALLIQTLRSTACNGLHSIEQRASRWMLTTLDRARTDAFEITHEFFGMLLGVRRASVSTLVEKMVKKGALEVSRGKIIVNNRTQLEKTSCECYLVIRQAYRDFIESTQIHARHGTDA